MTTQSTVSAMAFDFGTRYIGIAVGQNVTGTATALETVKVRGGKPDFAWIEKLITQWQPDVLVVGEPLNMDGTEQELTALARRFSRQLNGRFSLPVELVDERLTSVEAKHEIEALGIKGMDDHPIAAKIMLESWFAEQKQ